MMGVRWNTAGAGRWLRRVQAAAADGRGVALVTTLFIVFAIGMMLFAFAFLNQTEVGFAGLSRNSTIALGLAEAGIQDAINRLNTQGATPGSCFVNSLAGTGQCSGGTPNNPVSNAVGYQLPLQSNSSIFPILSVGTYAGTQRAVRVFAQATLKPGFGTIVFGPQVTYQGNANAITGDGYSQTNIVFQNYSKSPPPASGATATNLISPQVMAGTTISVTGGGPGPYANECAAGSTEVAPTGCVRATDGTTLVPVNWHPMTPIGMNSSDFNTLVSNCYSVGCSVTGSTYTVTVAQATQTQNTPPAVHYTPTTGGYTPAYWTGVPTTNGLAMLVYAPGPFCLVTSPFSVAVPTGAGGTCTSGSLYGASSVTMRFLDWGLVQDDLSRATAQTFYQPPTCSTCNGGLPNGKQNGIRYIPIVPAINVLPYACTSNENPGFSAFYNATTDGLTCANPPTQPAQVSGGSVTFTGTKSNPEFLVIDNTGFTGVSQATKIFGTGTATGCSDTFANANWGVILATGDIDLQGLVFNGFIYTTGSVWSHANPIIRGGIFSSTPPTTQVNSVDLLGTMTFCGGINTVPLVPQFYSFKTFSWQDRPSNLP